MDEPRLWLTEVRKQKEMSQQELADRASISRNYLSEIEGGSKNPSVVVAQRIAGVLGIEWTNFFTHEGRETQHTA